MADNARDRLTADARTVCDIVRTTLGPFGANKLVIGAEGTVTTTSSGSLVLDRLDIDNPAVSLLKTAASDFRKTEGDGASTLVALTGALLDEASRLSEMGLHPTVIERGFREAVTVACDHLDQQARPLSTVGVEAVARTALTGTRNPNTRHQLGNYLARVVDAVAQGGEFDPSMVKVSSRLGGAEAETELVAGVVLDRDPAAEGMPRSLHDTGVAVLTDTVDIPRYGGERSRTDTRLSLSVEGFEDRAAFADQEREAFRDQLAAAVDAGCQFIVTGMAINDSVKHDLANAGVLAVQRVDDADLPRIARVTGATIVPSLGELTEETLGTANVGLTRRAGRDLIVVEADANPVFTLFCRAPDERSVAAFERSVESALAAVGRAQSSGTVVAGGGAVEMSASKAVRDHARSVAGAEQLAIEAFGDALADIPRSLAVNGGMDGWRSVIRLRVATHEGRTTTGIDCIYGEIRDVLESDPIVEPADLKRDVWTGATDLAAQLVRIDAELEANDLSKDTPPKRADEFGIEG
ncbi:TCP-1/cpn60 chaperonin family protein [Haladaptatus sp. YSMS36]|uniref:TCP-1/cpn60 chaperonin family protein n=1 Tax=Haladaptatus sp. YSMS36 TaxID=3033384 RepID=UPI0023E8339B|nr:TCP-1/cpn60 chaperonin family protein [Haladaptatus sp. YSMS36]